MCKDFYSTCIEARALTKELAFNPGGGGSPYNGL